MRKGIIFDCDGVLTDTEAKFAAGSRDHLRSLGLDPGPEGMDEFAGVTMAEYAQAMIRRYHLQQTPAEFCAQEQVFLDPYFADLKLMPIPGAVAFITRLRELGIRLGIASSSGRDYVRHLTELFKIAGCFDFIVSGEMVSRSKPAPDIYLKAIEAMRLPKEELAVIEDSTAGIAAAKGAGLYTVGLKASSVWQDTSLADLEAPDYSAIDIDALIGKEITAQNVSGADEILWTVSDAKGSVR